MTTCPASRIAAPPGGRRPGRAPESVAPSCGAQPAGLTANRGGGEFPAEPAGHRPRDGGIARPASPTLGGRRESTPAHWQSPPATPLGRRTCHRPEAASGRSSVPPPALRSRTDRGTCGAAPPRRRARRPGRRRPGSRRYRLRRWRTCGRTWAAACRRGKRDRRCPVGDRMGQRVSALVTPLRPKLPHARRTWARPGRCGSHSTARSSSAAPSSCSGGQGRSRSHRLGRGRTSGEHGHQADGGQAAVFRMPYIPAHRPPACRVWPGGGGCKARGRAAPAAASVSRIGRARAG